MIRLFVGLGNPGFEYEATRHNAGFWWINTLARLWTTSLTIDRAYHALTARVVRAEGPIWLMQPQTFMNLSGKSVAALARFYKIAPQEILVVHDELDLLPGQMKLKLGGSSAGHNGLKDIHTQLGSPDFWRLRLGIGHPGVKAEVIHYVLRKPPASERDLIDACIDRSMEALPALVAADMTRAMMHLHVNKPPRPKTPRSSLGEMPVPQVDKE
jgi:PTH1 family peptidyl-tRNA hydrolase